MGLVYNHLATLVVAVFATVLTLLWPMFVDYAAVLDVVFLLAVPITWFLAAVCFVAQISADKNPGHEPEVFVEIDHLRPRNWPNSMMIDLADQLLGCNGAFNAALRSHHTHIAKRDPNLAELIRLHGRAHEIPEDI